MIMKDQNPHNIIFTAQEASGILTKDTRSTLIRKERTGAAAVVRAEAILIALDPARPQSLLILIIEAQAFCAGPAAWDVLRIVETMEGQAVSVVHAAVFVDALERTKRRGRSRQWMQPASA